MEIQEALKWTDDLVFSRTGKHLDSLQRAILEGVWECRGYKDIAEDYHCTVDHVRKTASELWQILSDILGEDIKKKNVRSIVENSVFSYCNDVVHIGYTINFGSDSYNHPPTAQNRSHPTTESQPRHDLSEAPENDRLYSRTRELATLKQWILAEHHRIVAITGLSGIGKTALARQLVEDIKENFDRVLWRSHQKYPNLNALKTDLIEFLAPPPPSQNSSILNYLRTRSSLLDYFRSHRCLIVLDDFQETLTPGEFVGTYQPEYDSHGQFLHEIGRSPHQSCFLFLSWEQPTEIATLETENRYCKTLHLQGLDATEILAARHLKDRQQWPELIRRYGGNPLWLNIIASTILDLFNGSVQKFLSYPTLFLGDVESILNKHYLRLSETEKRLMVGLAHRNGTADICRKPEETLSDSDYLKAVQSLRKRSLIETMIENSASILTLLPAIREYVKNQDCD